MKRRKRKNVRKKGSVHEGGSGRTVEEVDREKMEEKKTRRREDEQ